MAEPGRHHTEIADNIGDNTTAKQNIGILHDHHRGKCDVMQAERAALRPASRRSGAVCNIYLFSICHQPTVSDCLVGGIRNNTGRAAPKTRAGRTP
jgi:hypothetical protein